MGYSTGIQYGTAVFNKVNKPLTTNLNENTWKLVKLVISSFFNPPTHPTQIISNLAISRRRCVTPETDKWWDFVERVIRGNTTPSSDNGHC
jgi:hypothetical protein